MTRKSSRKGGLAVGVSLALMSTGFIASAAPMAVPRNAPSAAPAYTPTVASVRRISRYKIVRHGTFDMAMLARQAAAGQTAPFWTSSVTSPLDDRTYQTSMVGTSPFATTKTNTVVKVVPIALRVHFAHNLVFDPTKASPCDAQGGTVVNRLLVSPLMRPATFVSNGVNVSTGVPGGTELASAFQRANYWSLTRGTGYGVTLQNSLTTPIVVDINAPSGSSVISHNVVCESGAHKQINEALVDDTGFSNYVDFYARKYASPGSLVVIITYNVDTPLALGYHSAQAVAQGTQTYLWASYFDPGVVPPDQDISVFVHEFGEWLDDPFVQSGLSVGAASDTTPPWNNGMGCQNDLEVGDPLGSQVFPVTGAFGFVYHYPDLAFHDWFYRTPASGTGARYSFTGAFKTAAAHCP